MTGRKPNLKLYLKFVNGYVAENSKQLNKRRELMLALKERNSINIFLKFISAENTDNIVLSTYPTKRELEFAELHLMAKLAKKRELTEEELGQAQKLINRKTTGARFDYPLVDGLGLNINYPNSRDSGKTRLMQNIIMQSVD